MIFNSIVYLLFLTATVIAYYLFPGKFRWIWLLICSMGYYLSFIPVFLILLIGIVFINYFLARWLANIPDDRNGRFLFLIVVVNLLVLAFFKYFNIFFPEDQLNLYSIDFFFPVEPVNKMVLPLGLSYLMFTVLSYQIEIKRRNIQPERHFGYFSLYLVFFPRIAQGPIERPQHLLPQLHQHHNLNYNSTIEGLKLILWGYFKKLVIADRLAIYVNAVYNNSEYHNGTTLITATIFFAFQIYADFSGYTDIALGSAKLFGINLANNFRRPYLATSIKDFWDRWHITFSTWLRDYLFLPLAYYLTRRMNKHKYLCISKDKWIYLIAILVTFSICGLWHGVGWGYLIWGIIFGVYLALSNWAKDINRKIRKQLHIGRDKPFYVFYKVLLTFILVSLTWIFFRTNSITDSLTIIAKIFTPKGPLFIENPSSIIFGIFGILSLIIIDLSGEFDHTFLSRLYFKHSFIRKASCILLVLIILLIGVLDGGQFIYFQY